MLLAWLCCIPRRSHQNVRFTHHRQSKPMPIVQWSHGGRDERLRGEWREDYLHRFPPRAGRNLVYCVAMGGRRYAYRHLTSVASARRSDVEMGQNAHQPPGVFQKPWRGQNGPSRALGCCVCRWRSQRGRRRRFNEYTPGVSAPRRAHLLEQTEGAGGFRLPLQNPSCVRKPSNSAARPRSSPRAASRFGALNHARLNLITSIDHELVGCRAAHGHPGRTGLTVLVYEGRGAMQRAT